MNKKAQADGLHLGLFLLLIVALGGCIWLGIMLFNGKQSLQFHDHATSNENNRKDYPLSLHLFEGSCIREGALDAKDSPVTVGIKH